MYIGLSQEKAGELYMVERSNLEEGAGNKRVRKWLLSMEDLWC
jgi:hypothetical protein